jgi:hypothetical protein
VKKLLAVLLFLGMFGMVATLTLTASGCKKDASSAKPAATSTTP